jgi:hypothetical protein
MYNQKINHHSIKKTHYFICNAWQNVYILNHKWPETYYKGSEKTENKILQMSNMKMMYLNNRNNI